MSIETYKIRRLKWRREAGEDAWFSDTPVGRYLVERVTRRGEPDSWYASYCFYKIDAYYHATRSAATKACQSDFERRVAECLENDG